MNINYANLPIEIWADMLEDQGQDTSALRAWVQFGITGYYVIDQLYGSGGGHVHNSDGYGNGDGFHEYGNGYSLYHPYGNGYGEGYGGEADGYGNGDGFHEYGNGYSLYHPYGNGYGEGYGGEAYGEGYGLLTGYVPV